MRFDIQYAPGQYDDEGRQMHTIDQIAEMKSFLDSGASQVQQQQIMARKAQLTGEVSE